MSPDSRDDSLPDAWLHRYIHRILIALVGVAVVFAAIVAAFYVSFFPGPVVGSHERWGDFGDFFGGTLNPIFGFLSFVALTFALVLQGHELAISSRELKNSAAALKDQSASLTLQNFERTLFELLRLYNDNVRGLDLRAITGNTSDTGRNCFRYFYRERLRHYFDQVKADAAQKESFDYCVDAYKRFFDENQHLIGHCIRTLYRILRFIDESTAIHDDARRMYSGIVRAQLTTFELAVLFYHGLHPVGGTLKVLGERYALFENLVVSVLIDREQHVAFYASSAYGDQDLSYVSLVNELA